MQESAPKPMLQKPPGYRDPNTQAPHPPPRKPVLPPSFRPKPKRRSCCRVWCCTCCIIMLILLIAAGLFYLIYDPSLPEFRFASFRIPNLNVTNSEDGAYLDASTAARVEVKNPSEKMRWRFGETRVTVSSAELGDLNLGWTKVGGFKVNEKGVWEVKAETSVRNQALDYKQRRRVKSAVESKALVPSLVLQTQTDFSLQGGVRNWHSPTLSLTVICGGLTIRQLQQQNPPLCTITLLNWIKLP